MRCPSLQSIENSLFSSRWEMQRSSISSRDLAQAASPAEPSEPGPCEIRGGVHSDILPDKNTSGYQLGSLLAGVVPSWIRSATERFSPKIILSMPLPASGPCLALRLSVNPISRKETPPMGSFVEEPSIPRTQ